MTEEQKRAHARQQILASARAMLDGRLSFIEGARRIAGWRLDVGLAEGDADLMTFVAIESETDTLPFGEVRQLWQPAALSRLQPEIDRAEKWAAEIGRQPCQNLIRRLDSPD